MRVRRHLPPLREWRLALPHLTAFNRRAVGRWALALLGALLGGYLTAYLVLFPAPILSRHRVVPRALGLTVAEARTRLEQASLGVQDGGAEPHSSAPEGIVIWQDPPPDVAAREGLRVTLVASAGPPKIAVPDIAGLDGGVAERLVLAAGLAVARVESVQVDAPPGVAILTRPPAGSPLAPGAGLAIVVSRGAPTIAVPDLLGLSQADARTKLELEGLRVGSVTRRSTAGAAPGTIVAQRPAAGTLASPGTVVDLVVARSPS
ncbi:MAG: PASTA domain-containing protein [Gemmatimonadales bacterium]